MLHKLSLVTAVAACLIIPTTVFAGHGGGHGGGGHGGGMHAGGMHVGGMHVGGMHGGGMHVGGGGRHFWHGRWYSYGVGSCWRWTPVGYVWICG